MSKKNLKRIVIHVLFAAIIFMIPLVSNNVCSDLKVEAATIKINKKTLTITAGKKSTLKISGTKKKITWSTSNKNVAVVSSKGVVTAKKAGKAVITAKVKGGKKYKCAVTVKARISASKTSVTLNRAPDKTKVTISYAKKNELYCDAGNDDIVKATISNGVLTLEAGKKGSTTVTVYSYSGDKLTIKVTVKNNPVAVTLPTLPQTITDYSYYSTNIKVSVTKIWITQEYYSPYGQDADIKIHLIGKRISGDEDLCNEIKYKLYNKSGAVVESGEIYIPELSTGETYEVEEYVLSLKPGTYTLKLFDVN